MRSCDPSLLSRYLDNELGLPARVDLDRHLRACGLCSQELDDLRRIDRVMARYGAVPTLIPREVESRILASADRRGRLSPILALSRMMPAAVGSTIAGVLVLLSANLGLFYQQASVPSAQYAARTSQQQIQKQSIPLLNARRTSAITGGTQHQRGATTGAIMEIRRRLS